MVDPRLRENVDMYKRQAEELGISLTDRLLLSLLEEIHDESTVIMDTIESCR